MITNESVPSKSTSALSSDRLDSWKEIAAYLKRDERTVRRWETEGLPVHRKVHKKQASIFAYRAEIDAWWNSGRRQAEPAGTVPQAPPAAAINPLRLRSRRLWIPVALLGVLALGALAFDADGIRSRILGHRAPTIHSIAVLPLKNLSGDAGEEYFVEGMTEELTTELAQISTLKVISHTSAAQYQGANKSLPQIARELGVDAVVEGAVERSGDRVVINVQLIQAASDRHLWARSYDRSLRDVFGLQREVSHAIVGEIEAKELTVAKKTPAAIAEPVDSRSYENYLKGQFSLERGELKKSIAYFQEAIRESPNYARAYAGLANAYICLGQPWFADMAPKDVLPQAKSAAQKALDIDDSLGEAHLAMARVIQLYDWDWPRVEQEYRRALALNQNDALAHGLFAEFLQEMGRSQEALAEFRRAAALDPLNAWRVADVGYGFYTARQYDESIREYQKGLAADPMNTNLHVGLGWVYGQKKMYAEAIAELEKAVTLSGRHEVPLASLGQVLAESGRKRDAERILAELKLRSKHRYVSPCLIALVQLGLGERDQAIASLEQGYANHDQWILCMKVDPLLDDLRSDPRFKDLLRRIGLPE